MTLIASSFLVYLAYPIILLMLPLPRSIKLAAAAGVWFLSWGVFSAGVVLAGPQGYQKVKAFWSRLIKGRLGESKASSQIADKH